MRVPRGGRSKARFWIARDGQATHQNEGPQDHSGPKYAVGDRSGDWNLVNRQPHGEEPRAANKCEHKELDPCAGGEGALWSNSKRLGRAAPSRDPNFVQSHITKHDVGAHHDPPTDWCGLRPSGALQQDSTTVRTPNVRPGLS
jgi:hypothetical protein